MKNIIKISCILLFLLVIATNCYAMTRESASDTQFKNYDEPLPLSESEERFLIMGAVFRIINIALIVAFQISLVVLLLKNRKNPIEKFKRVIFKVLLLDALAVFNEIMFITKYSNDLHTYAILYELTIVLIATILLLFLVKKFAKSSKKEDTV